MCTLSLCGFNYVLNTYVVWFSNDIPIGASKDQSRTVYYTFENQIWQISDTTDLVTKRS